MLLLPGEPGRPHTYLRPWLDGLGQQLQLIYCDYKGNNPPNESAVELAGRLAQLDALRASLGYAQVLLFGHAEGGRLAQEYALRYGQRLAGLILCQTSPALTEPELNRLDEIFTPALIIAGRHDRAIPPWQAERLHALLPNSTLVIFDNSGHCPVCEDPATFVAMVAGWLAGLV